MITRVVRRFACVCLLFAQSWMLSPCARATEILAPGFRPLPPGVHALVGGRVLLKPGESVEGATIIIRDGLIAAVGKEAIVPADARVWDMKGLTIYAGFMDAYLTLGTTNAAVSNTADEAVAQDALTSGARFYGAPGQRTDAGKPGPGSDIAKVMPENRAVESYTPNAKSLETLRELGFTTGVIVPTRGILRGSSALVALADETPNRAVIKPDVFQHVGFETTDEDGDGSYPRSLMGVIAAVRQTLFDAQHYQQTLAAYEKQPVGRERPAFNLSLAALRPVTERKMNVVFEPGSALMVDGAARVARELNLDFALVSSGQEWRRPELARQTGVAMIVPVNFPTLPKLPSEDDWEQVSLDQLRAWDWAAENPALLRKQGLDIALTTHGLNDKKSFRKNLRQALERGLSEDDALAALTTVPAKLCGMETQLGTIAPGRFANLTVVDGKGYFDPEAKVREVWIDGRVYRNAEEGKGKDAKTQTAKAETGEEGEPAKEPAAVADKAPAEKGGKESATEKAEKKKAELSELRKKRVAHAPQEGRGPITNPPSIIVRGAMIWTCGPAGIQTNAELIVADGKVKEVRKANGQDVPAIGGIGLHVTPGLLDCHSHSAILGGVNEGSLPSSAMVRIGDVVNSETDNLYEQLAGGLTTANLLHGSANPIGGQNQVIKLRDGASPEELKFEGAMPGIKFALGENVKQSNAGDRNSTRFPQTRMGVRTFHNNRFAAAQEYLAAWDKFRKDGGVPPRRDLELEAIGEIILGKRIIHCHSYRQDEILAFLRTMESFGVKVGTLQHILEGYKVADEIAKHGAGASCFADWWAYKFEVYDAIPYAGSLMRDRGVLVSFNSDSSELARHMNHEAAKAVKYGSTPEIEALKFVTINPAKQLRIDARVGSLEPGKDADFVIWSGHPLDPRSMCLETWVDGKKYLDRSLAAARAEALQKERTDLIAKAKKLAKLSGGGGDDGGGGGDDGSFWRVALEHQHDSVERHCLDEEGVR